MKWARDHANEEAEEQAAKATLNHFRKYTEMLLDKLRNIGQAHVEFIFQPA